MKKIFLIISLLIIVISMSSCGVKQEQNNQISSDYEDAMQLRNSVVYDVEEKNILNVSSYEDGDTLCVDVLTDKLVFPYEEVFKNGNREQYLNVLKKLVGLSENIVIDGISAQNGIRLENGYFIAFYKESKNNYYISLDYSNSEKYDYANKFDYLFNYIKSNMGVNLVSNTDFNKLYNDFFENEKLINFSLVVNDGVSNIGISLLFNKLIIGNNDYDISSIKTDIYNYNRTNIDNLVFVEIESEMEGIKGLDIAHQINEEIYNIELITDNLEFPNEDKFSKLSDKNVDEYMYLLEDLVDSKYNKELSLSYGAEHVLIDNEKLLNALFFNKENDYYYTSVEYLLSYEAFERDLDKGFNYILKNHNINLKQCVEFMELYNEFINDDNFEILYFSILGVNDDGLSLDIIIDKSIDDGNYGSFLIQNVRMLN